MKTGEGSNSTTVPQKGTFELRRTFHQFRTEKEQKSGGYLDFARTMPLYDKAIISYSLSTTQDGLGIHPNLFHLGNGNPTRQLTNKDWRFDVRKTKVDGTHKIIALNRGNDIFEHIFGETIVGVDVTSALVTDEENGIMTIRYGHDSPELKRSGRGSHVRDAIKLTVIKARQERLEEGGQSLWGVLADRMGKDYKENKEEIDKLAEKFKGSGEEPIGMHIAYLRERIYVPKIVGGGDFELISDCVSDQLIRDSHCKFSSPLLGATIRPLLRRICDRVGSIFVHCANANDGKDLQLSGQYVFAVILDSENEAVYNLMSNDATGRYIKTRMSGAICQFHLDPNKLNPGQKVWMVLIRPRTGCASKVFSIEIGHHDEDNFCICQNLAPISLSETPTKAKVTKEKGTSRGSKNKRVTQENKQGSSSSSSTNFSESPAKKSKMETEPAQQMKPGEMTNVGTFLDGPGTVEGALQNGGSEIFHHDIGDANRLMESFDPAPLSPGLLETPHLREFLTSDSDKLMNEFSKLEEIIVSDGTANGENISKVQPRRRRRAKYRRQEVSYSADGVAQKGSQNETNTPDDEQKRLDSRRAQYSWFQIVIRIFLVAIIIGLLLISCLLICS